MLFLLNILLPQLHIGPLDEECIAHVLRGVLQALAYLHEENRIHRDVKVGERSGKPECGPH